MNKMVLGGRSSSSLRQYLDCMFTRLKINLQEDWYRTVGSDFEKEELLHYGHLSHISAITSAYPEYQWFIWKFSQVPFGFWKDKQNIQSYFDWLGEHLNIETQEDWYAINVTEIVRRGEGGAFPIYNFSPQRALKDVYPQYEWIDWKFNLVSRNFWNKLENRRRCMDWFATQYGIETQEDWYGLVRSDFIDTVGWRMLRKYSNSLHNALKEIYPEFQWFEWRFSSVSSGFWNTIDNQKMFFDWLGEELDCRSTEDWYSISYRDIKGIPLQSILSHYGGSLMKALGSVYPEKKWQDWMFVHKKPNGFWKDTSTQQRFFSWLGVQLDIQKPSDWHQISRTDIKKLGGSSMLQNYNGIAKMLSSFHPNHSWKSCNIFTPLNSNSIPKDMNSLLRVLTTVLPNNIRT